MFHSIPNTDRASSDRQSNANTHTHTQYINIGMCEYIHKYTYTHSWRIILKRPPISEWDKNTHSHKQRAKHVQHIQSTMAQINRTARRRWRRCCFANCVVLCAIVVERVLRCDRATGAHTRTYERKQLELARQRQQRRRLTKAHKSTYTHTIRCVVWLLLLCGAQWRCDEAPQFLRCGVREKNIYKTLRYLRTITAHKSGMGCERTQRNATRRSRDESSITRSDFHVRTCTQT